jgi:hypothetical protein
MTYPTNISRPNKHRWLFSIRINGKRHNKSFSDKEYGGEKEAYEAALKYKEKVYAENNLVSKGRGSSGPIKGVSRTSSKRRKYSGKISEETYWQAVWADGNGKQHTKRFSVRKHGEKKAKQLATWARKDALEAMEKGFDPRFIQPTLKYAKLWRYMDFTKLLSLLEDSAIFLAPATSFEDPYEGFLPKGNITLSSFVKSKSKDKGPTNVIVADKEKVLINCWHMSTYESAAMWKLYGKGNETVCVTTKYSKLKNQLTKGAQIGLVQYVDFNTAWVPENNPYYPFMFKRKSFEYEKEVRVLMDSDHIEQHDLLLSTSHGYKNKVDLNALIDEVYVAPDASDWFFELVRTIVDKYGLKAKVTRSQLLSMP